MISSKKSIILIILLLAITGCAGQMNKQKSSMVEYLYSEESGAIVKPSIPVLNLPIKVGIAFVPVQSIELRGKNLWTGATANIGLTEADKSNILEKVADNFRELDYVSEIEVIPSAYLTSKGGFSNLEQLQTMYGIDVIALVSLDQVQFTDTDKFSLSYLTLIGVYFVKGEKNDTHTMLDTAVFDITSKKMLFRAPGTSNVKGRASPVDLNEELRADSIKGIEAAAVEMALNLEIQLEKLKDKIKQSPEQIKVISHAGSGGGSVGIFSITAMLFSAMYLFINREKKV